MGLTELILDLHHSFFGFLGEGRDWVFISRNFGDFPIFDSRHVELSSIAFGGCYFTLDFA